MSEAGVIATILASVSARPGTLLGIGDDAALIEGTGPVALTHDLLVDGVHFRRAWTDEQRLGRRALAVNLSDLAAMGARPVAALVGLAMPHGLLDEAAVGRLYAGMDALAAEHGVTIAGGDVSAAPALILAVTAAGRFDEGTGPVTRAGARAGDLVCVTGPLGASAAGLALLERPALAEAVPDAERLRDAHLAPRPRVREGPILARAGARAMMDISDGLGIDLDRLARASGLRARLEIDAIPLAPGLAAAAGILGRDAPTMALAGGEDYELLVALGPRERRAAEREGVALHPVGTLREGDPGVEVVDAAGAAVVPPALGWEHDV